MLLLVAVVVGFSVSGFVGVETGTCFSVACLFMCQSGNGSIYNFSENTKKFMFGSKLINYYKQKPRN